MNKTVRLLFLFSFALLNKVCSQCPTADIGMLIPDCINSIINFNDYTDYTGITENFTYSWNFGTGATPQTSLLETPNDVNYSSTGTKTVTFTLTGVSSGCTSSVTATFDLYQNADASITYSPTITCMGQAIDFYNGGSTGDPSYIHSWDFGNGNTSALENNTGIVYPASGAITITHSVSTGSIGCANQTQTQTIIINPTPVVTFNSTAPVCKNQTVDFINSGSTGNAFSYSWDFGSGATPNGATSENPAGIVYSTSGVKTVTFAITNNYGCINSSTQNISINAAPLVSFTSTATQCTGMPVDFTNTGDTSGVTWLWNFDAGATPGTSTTQNPTGVVYSTAGTKTITLTATSIATGCVVAVSQALNINQTININQTPTVSFTSTAPQCANTPVNFTNTGSSDTTYLYSWDLGSGAIPNVSTSENPTGIEYITSGTKTITFIISNTSGCINSSTQNITIKPTPLVSFTSTATQCTGMPVDFTNTGDTSGVTMLWNFGTGATPGSSTTPNPTNIIYSTAGTKTITLTSTDTLSGCAVTSTQTININQTPTSSFTSIAPQCVNIPVDFTNTGSTGGSWSYFWDFGQGAIPQTSSSENPGDIKYSSGAAKTVTLTIFNGYCTQTSIQTIFIDSLPEANAGLDTTICANTNVQIGGAFISGNTYNWFPESTLNNPTISNPIASPVAPITEYILTVTNIALGCINYDTINVTMLSSLISNAGNDGEICRYDSVQLGTGLYQGQIYSWTPGIGLSSATLPNPVSSPATTTTYTLTVTGSNCAAETDQITITVHPLPLVNAGIDATIAVGSSTQLVATGGVQYMWSPAYGLSNNGLFDPIANPDTTISYVLVGTDVFGCVNRDTVMVKVIGPSVWLPTAFTPDGNGENDEFYVMGEGVSNFEFGIYNRWGEMVFYSTSIDQRWNGKRQITGELLPSGAYVYFVKGILSNDDIVNINGLVNLIR